MSNQLETIVIDGKEIDLSTATRDDLIHYLHIYVSAWQKAKQDFFNVQRFFAIALKQLGGKMDIDRRELLEVSGTEIERTEEDSRTLRFCISNHNNPHA